MSNLLIKRVNVLPVELTASTLYMVKSEKEGHVELHITGNDAQVSRRIITVEDVDSKILAAVNALEDKGVDKLENARTIALTGDASASFEFDGSEDVSTAITLAETGVVAGEHTKVTVDAKGRVTAGAALAQEDIPALDPTKINAGTLTDVDTTGNAATATKLADTVTINGVEFDGSDDIVINAEDSTPRVASSLLGQADGVATLDSSGHVPASQLPSYVDDVLEFADEASFPAEGESGKIYINIENNTTYRWTGSQYLLIPGGVGLADAAIKLNTARKIESTGDVAFEVTFDGTKNVAGEAVLANTGVNAGTHTKVTVDAKGRVTNGGDLEQADIPNLDPTKINAGTLTDVDTTGNAATADLALVAQAVELVDAEW